MLCFFCCKGGASSEWHRGHAANRFVRLSFQSVTMSMSYAVSGHSGPTIYYQHTLSCRSVTWASEGSRDQLARDQVSLTCVRGEGRWSRTWKLPTNNCTSNHRAAKKPHSTANKCFRYILTLKTNQVISVSPLRVWISKKCFLDGVLPFLSQ